MNAPRTFPEAIGVIPALRTIRGFTVTSDGRVYGRSGRLLSPYLVSNGYLRVGRWDGGRHATEYVHRLVCEAFHGPQPEWAEVVRHLDGNPLNNHAENLAYGTYRDNEADKADHGRTVLGEKCNLAKLTEEQVREIRAYPPEVTHVELGTMYGVSGRNISLIRNGRTWRHVA